LTFQNESLSGKKIFFNSPVLSIVKRFSKGKIVGDIADVQPGKVEVMDSELYVDEIYVTNSLGTENARKLFAKEGIAAVIFIPERKTFALS